MGKIVLTSCGIIHEEFKNRFYQVISKEELKYQRVLYITTAADGEMDEDKSWMGNEFQTILDLGIQQENIIEYKIGKDQVDFDQYDIIYMMGGNTFYLLDMIQKYHFDKVIKSFLNQQKIYIGSSAGSIILGNSIEYALPFDENLVNMTDFTGLQLVDGIIIPHANRKAEFIEKVKHETKDKLFVLEDGDGIVLSNQHEEI